MPRSVLFRSHLGIMLILTLSISAFKPEEPGESNKAGDYSAIFPLLVIAVFTALMSSMSTTFYTAQTSRADIVAVPEILCRPGRTGNPSATQFGSSDGDDDSMMDSVTSKVSNTSTPGKSSTDIQQMLTPHPSQDDKDMMAPETGSPSQVHKLARENSLSRSIQDNTSSVSHHRHDYSGSISGSLTSEKKASHQAFGNLDGHQQPSLLDQARQSSNNSFAHSHSHSFYRSSSSNQQSFSFSDASPSSK
jgi:hypothetical protein